MSRCIWQVAASLSLLLFIKSAAYAAGQPWDSPFSEDIKGTLEAARVIPRKDHPSVLVLLEEYKYAVHAGGRTDLTIRKVYRVDDKDEIEEWSTVEREYQPWYQQKPELRARVISTDGVPHWLDPKTIADSPAREFESSIYSDNRVVRAPLPSVAAGAIVEYQITIHDTAPLLDTGVTYRIPVVETTPITVFHIVIDAEPGVAIRSIARNIAEQAVSR